MHRRIPNGPRATVTAAVEHYELKPGGKFRCLANEQMRYDGSARAHHRRRSHRGEAASKLVQTYRFLFNEDHVKEGYTRISFEVEPTGKGFCRLTVTHDTGVRR